MQTNPAFCVGCDSEIVSELYVIIKPPKQRNCRPNIENSTIVFVCWGLRRATPLEYTTQNGPRMGAYAQGRAKSRGAIFIHYSTNFLRRIRAQIGFSLLSVWCSFLPDYSLSQPDGNPICVRHSYETWLIHTRHDSFIWDMTHSLHETHAYETWLIHMRHDLFIWDMMHSCPGSHQENTCQNIWHLILNLIFCLLENKTTFKCDVKIKYIYMTFYSNLKSHFCKN